MSRGEDDGVLASAVEVVAVAEAERLIAAGEAPFAEGELRYARARADPGRRLAARLAAKRAACRLLGDGALLEEVEVERGEEGPPALRLVGAAEERMRALGASRALVSLTHEREHAGALVVLLRDAG